LTKRTHIKTIEDKSKVMWCDCHWESYPQLK